jgi:hypothetical protein
MTPLPLRSLVSAAVLALLVTGCEPAVEAPVASKVEIRKTIGKTTQNVLDLSRAIADGGVPAEMSIEGGGLDVVADAYRTSVGKLAVVAVEQKMKLHEAEHGSTPKSYDEFMREIIQPGSSSGLQLPMLPYYQEYAYDVARMALVVVEFPEKKAEREKQTTGPAGL